MPDASVQTIQLPVSNALANTDSVIALCNTGAAFPNTVIVTLENLFSNSEFDLTVQNGCSFILAGPAVVPAHANSNGTPGMLSWSGNTTVAQIYFCVANGAWGRANLQMTGW